MMRVFKHTNPELGTVMVHDNLQQVLDDIESWLDNSDQTGFWVRIEIDDMDEDEFKKLPEIEEL